MGLAIAVAVLWLNFDSLSIVKKWAGMHPTYIPLTALIYAVPVYLLGTAVNRLWLSGVLAGTAALLLALVDYFKMTINGTPLELMDFKLAAQLGDVAGVAGDLTPPIDFWRALTALLACTALLFLFRRLTVLKGQIRFLSFSGALLALLYLFSAGGAQTLGNIFDVDVYARMPAASNHRFYGSTLALWRDAVIQDVPPPEGYSREYMEQVLARIDERLAEGRPAAQEDASVRPNVILILSESFFDLTHLPGLEYGRDPLENFHALEAESVSGTFHSHYLGYGTGYVEMSMQYGLTNLDFGPSTNICFLDDASYGRFDALAEQFTNTGYRAEMLHGFDDSMYHRTVTFPMLGYDALYFSQDIQQLGFDWTGSIYGGYYMRDSYLFQGMLDRMRAINAGGQRAFLYGITMENHQPYDPDKFGHECRIPLIAGDLDPDQQALVQVLLEGVTRADQALGELADALRDSPEPTIVAFFGDHRPNLLMPNGDTVYSLLGLCPEDDALNWTPEQINDLYSTDYLIWANDASLLKGQAGTRKESSATALGPQLLELTGQPASRYWRLLEEAGKVCLTRTDLYVVDGAGRPSLSLEDAGLSPEALELLELRDAVVYDAIYGKQYITDAMNQAPGA